MDLLGVIPTTSVAVAELFKGFVAARFKLSVVVVVSTKVTVLIKFPTATASRLESATKRNRIGLIEVLSFM